MQRPKRNPQIIWRHEKGRERDLLAAMERGEDVADRGVVILIDGGIMHQLNLVGGTIWTLCDGSRSEAEIVDALAHDFAADRAEISGDVQAFLADLEERRWLIDG